MTTSAGSTLSCFQDLLARCWRILRASVAMVYKLTLTRMMLLPAVQLVAMINGARSGSLLRTANVGVEGVMIADATYQEQKILS